MMIFGLVQPRIKNWFLEKLMNKLGQGTSQVSENHNALKTWLPFGAHEEHLTVSKMLEKSKQMEGEK